MGVSAAGFRETSVFNPSRLTALIRLTELYRGSTANHSLWDLPHCIRNRSGRLHAGRQECFFANPSSADRTKACPELRRDGKRHTYFALVESQRTERGPRQRIVAQLGELTHDQQRCWQRTAVFHSRHKACPEPRRDGGELPLFVDEGPAPPPALRGSRLASYADWAT